MELVCPRDHTALARRSRSRDVLACENGHVYPIYDGIPVLLIDDSDQTHGEALRALDPETAKRELMWNDGTTPPPNDLHPVIRAALGATCGHMYFAIRNKIDHYPIPTLRLPDGNGETLLDIGCNWGRWTVAAAQRGYRAAVEY